MPSNSKEYQKEYYAKHKATAGKQSELIRCDCCDKNVSKWNLAKHKKTAKHISNASPKQSDILSELEIIKLELRELTKSNEKDASDPLVYCCGCQESFRESEKKKHKCKKTAKPICKLNI
jgi:hypothetical protein